LECEPHKPIRLIELQRALKTWQWRQAFTHSICLPFNGVKH
jgi:hypothetical protein